MGRRTRNEDVQDNEDEMKRRMDHGLHDDAASTAGVI
jgi:hypothetical protein